MRIGDTAVVPIGARPRWNDSHLTLEAGGRYALSATGEWTDWRNRCRPAGYASPTLVLRLSRGPGGPRPSRGSP